jgi:hypothetical protein
MLIIIYCSKTFNIIYSYRLLLIHRGLVPAVTTAHLPQVAERDGVEKGCIDPPGCAWVLSVEGGYGIGSEDIVSGHPHVLPCVVAFPSHQVL